MSVSDNIIVQGFYSSDVDIRRRPLSDADKYVNIQEELSGAIDNTGIISLSIDEESTSPLANPNGTSFGGNGIILKRDVQYDVRI